MLQKVILLNFSAANNSHIPRAQSIRAHCKAVAILSPSLRTFGIVWIFGIFDCHNLEGTLLASHGERPGTLLIIPKCTGQPPTTKDYAAPNVNGLRLRNSVYNKST